MVLSKGYLDMDRCDYAALKVEKLRIIFIELRDIVRYTMGKDAASLAVAERVGLSPTPIDWIMAIKSVVCRCERCKGTGIYSWGACINGCMSHSASCARCAGKGYMTFDDMRRGKAYDVFAIIKACRG